MHLKVTHTTFKVNKNITLKYNNSAPYGKKNLELLNGSNSICQKWHLKYSTLLANGDGVFQFNYILKILQTLHVLHSLGEYLDTY